MKPTGILFLVMIISLGIAFFWNSFPLIKDTIHFLLNPTAGKLLNFNLNFGMLTIAGIIALFLTLIQKYTVDNETLRKLKQEQKLLQEEMKKFRGHPEKLLELQKKQFEFIPKTMDITLRPLIYTAIPIILFFRWFSDYFTALPGVKIFGFFSWFWAYLIFSLIFSMIFRKMLKLP